MGEDNDLGYGITRADEDQAWEPRYLVQPLWNFLNACFFEYGIAAYDLDLGETLRHKRAFTPELNARVGKTVRKVRRQLAKDYLWAPAAVRPLGPAHPDRKRHAESSAQSVEPLGDHDERETHGRWYLRQMLGSADISGSKVLHILAGNLSHQIEHHPFPDLPGNPYGRDRSPGACRLRALRAEISRRTPAPAGGGHTR